jgi:hypothetical protein
MLPMMMTEDDNTTKYWAERRVEQDDVDDEDNRKKTIQRSRYLKELNKMMLMKMIMEDEDNKRE